MTAWIKDKNGYWEQKGVAITKIGVNEYHPSETEIKPEDGKYTVRILRPAEELSKLETIDSLKNKPFVNEHEFIGENGVAPEEKGVSGTIGEDVFFDGVFLRGNIIVWSEKVKDLIDNGKVELSAGYTAIDEAKSGLFQGEKYDGIQTNIYYNHVALVDEGRAGHDVRFLDKKKKKMKTTVRRADSLPWQSKKRKSDMDLKELFEKLQKGEDLTPEEKQAVLKAFAELMDIREDKKDKKDESEEDKKDKKDEEEMTGEDKRDKKDEEEEEEEDKRDKKDESEEEDKKDKKDETEEDKRDKRDEESTLSDEEPDENDEELLEAIAQGIAESMTDKKTDKKTCRKLLDKALSKAYKAGRTRLAKSDSKKVKKADSVKHFTPMETAKFFREDSAAAESLGFKLQKNGINIAYRNMSADEVAIAGAKALGYKADSANSAKIFLDGALSQREAYLGETRPMQRKKADSSDSVLSAVGGVEE